MLKISKIIQAATALLFLTVSPPAHALIATQVADLNQAPRVPQQVGVVALSGSDAYFISNYTIWNSANTQITGYHVSLQKLPSGTANGVSLVELSQLGIINASGLLRVGNKFYFSARTTDYGNEPWVSDGTKSGTHLLVDLLTGNGDGMSGSFTQGNGYAYFGDTSSNLWRTDGTPAGTIKLPVSGVDTNSYYTSGIHLYFIAGGSLWRTSGTAASTISLGQTLDKPSTSFATMDGLVYLGNDELFVSDGSAQNTGLLYDPDPGTHCANYCYPGFPFPPYCCGGDVPNDADTSDLTVVGETLYFTASIGSTRYLWKSDGTDTGTTTVLASAGDSFRDGRWPRSLVGMGTNLYFLADDNAGITQLFKSDGSTAGTSPIFSHTGIFSPIANGSELYFWIVDGSTLQLWKSNGSSTGTQKVIDLPVATDYIGWQTVQGGRLVFGVGTDYQLWVSDGTAAGTKPVGLGGGNSQSSNPGNFMQVNGKLLFTAKDGVNGEQAWSLDGVDAVPVKLHNYTPLPFATVITGAGSLGSKAILQLDGEQLWVTDGTSNGTRLLFTGNMEPSVSVYGNLACFKVINNTSTELWRTDGTVAGTFRVDMSTDISAVANLGGYLLYKRQGENNTRQLCSNNGTTGGSFAIGDISYNDLASVAGNKVFFPHDDGVHGSELWCTEGTTASTTMVADITPGTTGTQISLTGAAGSYQLFFAPGLLWATNGTPETTQVIMPAFSFPQGPFYCVAGTNSAYLSYNDGQHGYEPWITDGTPEGTHLLDVNPGPAGSGYFINFKGASIGNDLYWFANDAIHGVEPMVTDGTLSGTHVLKDLIPGSAGASSFDVGYSYSMGVSGTTLVIQPGAKWYVSDASEAGTQEVLNSTAPGLSYIVYGNRLFFAGGDPQDPDYELWSVPLPVSGPPPPPGSNYLRKFTDTTPAINEFFGTSIAAAKGQIAIGEPGELGDSSHDGAALLFNSGTGALLRKISFETADSGTSFGQCLAFSGKTLMVGMPRYTGPDAGGAVLYDTKLGTLQRTFGKLPAGATDYFGSAVAAGKKGIWAFGVPGDDSQSHDVGSVTLFALSQSVPFPQITPPTAAPDQHFGAAVAFTGANLMVGAPGRAASAGIVYLYDAKTRAATGTLGYGGEGEFGAALAVSGTSYAVGAPGLNDCGGIVLYSTKAGSNTAVIAAPECSAGQRFGASIAFTAKIFIVGAPGANGAGAAYVYSRKTNDLLATLTDPDARIGDGFGTAVGSDGKTVFVGAPGALVNNHENAGAVYQFAFPSGK